jgi:hypothetical protein
MALVLHLNLHLISMFVTIIAMTVVSHISVNGLLKHQLKRS